MLKNISSLSKNISTTINNTTNNTINISTILLIFTIIVLIVIILFNTLNKPKELFYNTNSNNSNNSNNKKFNEITYGMNPRCYNAGKNTTLSKYCPNKHPNIPCSLVKDCNNNIDNRLTDTMKRDIYLYVYLSGLLESSDIFNSDKDHYWFK
jgi:hypothetical protein